MTNAPTRAVDRQHFVDVLRGFALLGILVVNVEFLMHPAEVGWAGFDSTIDSIVKGTVIALGQAKVYPIFATLFGYGLALQLQRAPDDLWPRHRRRMLILAALGVLHGIFFFVGDILLLYACVGLLAFRFRDWPTARLLRLAGIVYAIATTIWLLLGAVDRSGLAVPALDPDYVSALESGSFLDVAVAQFPIWLVTALVLFVIQGPTVFVSYCLGIALGRTTWLSAPETHPDIIRRVLLWFPLGMAGSVFAAWLTMNSASTSTLGFALGFVFGPLVAAGYVAGLAVFVGNKDSLASKLLRPTGRVSLTVYLFESVVVAGLTYGYGFGLLGELGPLGNVSTAVAVWATLSAAAVLWIRRYRFGPIEWALRSLTYRRRQPLHR